MSTQYRCGNDKRPSNQYAERKDLDCFSCDISCLCKFVDSRSTFDMMQQDILVCGDSDIHLPVVPNAPNNAYPCKSEPYRRG